MDAQLQRMKKISRIHLFEYENSPIEASNTMMTVGMAHSSPVTIHEPWYTHDLNPIASKPNNPSPHSQHDDANVKQTFDFLWNRQPTDLDSGLLFVQKMLQHGFHLQSEDEREVNWNQ